MSVRKITTGKGSNKKTRHELSLTFDHKKEKIILENGPNFLERLAKLEPKKLRINQAYALKIGGSQITNGAFDSLEDLQAYTSRMSTPHSRKGYDALSVVIITSMEAPFRPEFDNDEDYDD